MANTGYKRVLTLRKYVNGVATTSTKANHTGDQDYVAPIYDADLCTGGITTTTTTTSTTTEAPTTTSAQESVGRIAAIALCTGSNGSCTSTLTRSGTNIVYVKIKDSSTFITNLVKSRQDVGSLRNGKYVIDNTGKNLNYLDGGMSGFLYNRDEGIVDENTVVNSPESIDATTSAGAGDYLVSAISILDAGEDPESTGDYYPKNAPILSLYYSSIHGRMAWTISNCLNIGGNNTVDNDFLGGDGSNANDSIRGNDSLVDGSHEDAAQEQ